MNFDTDDIVGALYAGTLDGEAWSGAILRLTDMLGASGAILLAFNPATGAVLRHELHRIDPEAMRQYQGYYAAKDPRIPPGALFPVEQPMSEGHLLPMHELTRSEIYSDFLRPFDIPHFLATWLHKAPDRLVALTFHGSHRHGPFGREETERLVPLLPHLSQALEIRDRLEMHQFRADTLVAAADRLTFGVLVLDGVGRILEANVVAQTLLAERQSIWRDADGTLCLSGPAGQALRQWIRDGAPARRAVDGMLHVLRSDGRLPVSVFTDTRQRAIDRLGVLRPPLADSPVRSRTPSIADRRSNRARLGDHRAGGGACSPVVFGPIASTGIPSSWRQHSHGARPPEVNLCQDGSKLSSTDCSPRHHRARCPPLGQCWLHR